MSCGSLVASVSSGALSSPSYSILERRDGQLTTGLEEKVTWPQRPVFGRYSEVEEMKSRRHLREKKKESSRAVQSDILVAPWMQPDKAPFEFTTTTNSRSMLLIPSEMFGIEDEDFIKSYALDTNDFGTEVNYTESWKTNSSRSSTNEESDWGLQNHDFLSGVDVSTAKSTRSEPSLSEGRSFEAKKPFGHLGVCTRVDALEQLCDFVAVLFYELVDEANIPLRMGLRIRDRKYVFSAISEKLENGELVWRLEDEGGKTKPSFRSLETMVRFYSMFPEAAAN